LKEILKQENLFLIIIFFLVEKVLDMREELLPRPLMEWPWWKKLSKNTTAYKNFLFSQDMLDEHML
jgi:hypothetical protein